MGKDPESGTGAVRLETVSQFVDPQAPRSKTWPGLRSKTV